MFTLMRFRNYFTVYCFDRNGNLKWEELFVNLVVTEGLTYSLGVALASTTQLTAWYLGLKGVGSPAAGDTMASHAGWTEITLYSQATRPIWTPGTVTTSVDNSGSPATFSINASSTVGGVFLVSNSTKGGTTGTLFSAGDFASSQPVNNGDSLNVTWTSSIADA